MNDADEKAFEAWCSDSGLWVDGTLLEVWQACCEWRDSQAGEPRYWVHNFGDEDGGEEFFDHPTGSDCPECVPLYLAPPTTQINQQLVEALEKITEVNEDTPVKTYQEMERIAKAALAATQMRGDA